MKSLIFASIAAVLTALAAGVSLFLLMWSMMHFPAAVKPKAYTIFAVCGVAVVCVAAAVAGPGSVWAGRRLFPGSEKAVTVFCSAATLAAVVIGGFVLFVASAASAAMVEDKLPRYGSLMRVRFPDNASLIHDRHQNAATYDEMVIVRMDEQGWQDFRRGGVFETDNLRIEPADSLSRSELHDWRTFENAETRAQSYRWMNHSEPAHLRALALRSGDRVYVYLYLRRGGKD